MVAREGSLYGPHRESTKDVVGGESIKFFCEQAPGITLSVASPDKLEGSQETVAVRGLKWPLQTTKI